ncbi:MAG TPA: pyridoxamine 5'-phosphate oxidase family protein [Acidimicrobiales bacterium]|nr:pyridoxamine 5'-phosphate oxidase family protein [Acidimicrobiales bacterium]
MAQRELEPLSEEECFALLGGPTVGRLVYIDDVGPIAVPVNYAVAGRDIVVRVEGGTKRAAMRQPVITFEVDHIDEAARSGWSVVVRGTGREVETAGVASLLQGMGGRFPSPWAFGVHNVWLQITPVAVTGRRLAAERTASIF